LPNDEKMVDTASFKEHTLAKGDTVFYSRGLVILDTVVVNPQNTKYNFGPNDTALMAELTVFSSSGTSYKSRPVFQVKDNQAVFLVDSVFSQNLAIAFTGVGDDRKIKLQVKESNAIMDFITIKAYKFPFINLLWLGTILMVTGFFISAINRREKKRLANLKSKEEVKVMDSVA
jgi:cytochrome c-type biogenesis protein CcmF